MISNRAIAIAAIIGGILSIAISISQGNTLLSFLAAFFFFLSILFWRYGYIIFPMITRAAKVVEVRGGYEIPPSRDYLIKKSATGYHATKFLEIQFYESSRDKDSPAKQHMFESFEKAISSLKYIVKISMMVSPLDLSIHIDDIKTKRSAAESRRAKISDSGDAVKIDREISSYNKLLERLTHGEKPVEITSYASTTAFGLTREDAISRVKRQANEVKTILSSSLGCDIVELSDLGMIKCFEWDSFFPTTSEELKDEVF